MAANCQMGGGSSEGDKSEEGDKPAAEVPPTGEQPPAGDQPAEGDKPATDVPAGGDQPVEGNQPAGDTPAEGSKPAEGGGTASDQPATDPDGAGDDAADPKDKEPTEEEAEYFAVSFYSEGELLEVQSVKAGEKASEPAVPVREGYTFLGWAESEEGEGFFNFDTEIDGVRNLYARWEPAAEKDQAVRARKAVARSAAEVEYSMDGGTTWEEADTLLDAFWNGGMSAKSYEIRLLRDITIDDNNWNGQQNLTFNNELLLDGQGHTITRGGSGRNIITVAYSSTMTLKNITIDGGAVWSGGSPDQRSNSGISCSGNQQMIWVYDGATLILEEGAVIENCDIRDDAFLVQWNWGKEVLAREH